MTQAVQGQGIHIFVYTQYTYTLRNSKFKLNSIRSECNSVRDRSKHKTELKTKNIILIYDEIV